MAEEIKALQLRDAEDLMISLGAFFTNLAMAFTTDEKQNERIRTGFQILLADVSKRRLEQEVSLPKNIGSPLQRIEWSDRLQESIKKTHE